MDLVHHGRPAPAAVLDAAGPHAGLDDRGRGKERMAGSRRLGGALRNDLDEVFRRDYLLVVGVAARVLGSHDHAEDVAQEVFLSFNRSSVPAGGPAAGSPSLPPTPP